ncbi:PEP-CTERM sorting domain-containing protein [Lacipirellula parvula]|uniref:Ice-binding protein C-terminal domain-containing protein n=1 Tax=Lacipirellula parvula TaxID=2650471 RepID=A0A5K7XKK1_9BACT|nr:PEP-CTERM sorting domain-containing protein [Lacipirellula parvula]BBO34823.1 hypothetical protein PLANPX_4435 [Lacipirellula parvula]
MTLRNLALAGALCALAGASAQAATLYSENFDVNVTPNWTVNSNGAGTNAANFFYDYSAMGIPSAPNSGGSTVGMKLQANISGTGPASGIIPGISASPTGQSFSGDYKLQFDWWQNWIGGTTGGIGNTAGGSGSTQLSTYGIMSSGTVSNYAGAADSVFFGATGDGASAADFRAYSPAKTTGYIVGDAAATYAAASTNSSAALYQTLFPAGATVPAAQNTAFPTTQFGTSVAGAAGFRWHNVVIEKVGAIVTWTIDGTLVATVNTTGITTGGNNILFGMADTSLGAGTPAATFAAVDFTLIDNVRVTNNVPEPASLALVGLAGLGLAAARRRRA